MAIGIGEARVLWTVNCGLPHNSQMRVDGTSHITQITITPHTVLSTRSSEDGSRKVWKRTEKGILCTHTA